MRPKFSSDTLASSHKFTDISHIIHTQGYILSVYRNPHDYEVYGILTAILLKIVSYD